MQSLNTIYKRFIGGLKIIIFDLTHESVALLEFWSGTQALFTAMFVLFSPKSVQIFGLWAIVLVIISLFQIVALFKFMTRRSRRNLKIRHKTNIYLFSCSMIMAILFSTTAEYGYIALFGTNALMSAHCAFVTHISEL